MEMHPWKTGIGDDFGLDMNKLIKPQRRFVPKQGGSQRVLKAILALNYNKPTGS